MHWTDPFACGQATRLACVVLLALAAGCTTVGQGGGPGGHGTGRAALSGTDGTDDAAGSAGTVEQPAPQPVQACEDGACPGGWTCTVVTASWGSTYRICTPPDGQDCARTPCDDGDPCTEDTCDEGGSCVHELLPADVCDATAPVPLTDEPPPPSTDGGTRDPEPAAGESTTGDPADTDPPPEPTGDDPAPSAPDATDPAGSTAETETSGKGKPSKAGSNPEAQTEPPAEASGAFRTQTPGGWGSTCDGGNAGCYRDWWFPICLPGGLTVGSAACGQTLVLATSQAVEDLLPTGGESGALPDGGVLLGHVVAASLSVAFDTCNPDFGASSTPLADLVACPGKPCAGSSVAEILAAGHAALGGCGSAEDAEVTAGCLTAINEAFVGGGKSTGYLCLP